MLVFLINIANQNYVIVSSLQTLDLDSDTNLEKEITHLKDDFIATFTPQKESIVVD